MDETCVFPEVAYHQHPAFKHLPAAPSQASKQVANLLRGIDESIEDIRAGSRRVSMKQLSQQFKEEVDPRLAEIARLAAMCTQEFPREVEAIEHAVAAARDDLLEEVAYCASRHGFRAKRSTKACDQVVDELAANGIVCRHVDSLRLRRINQHLAGYRREAESRRSANPTGRCVLQLPMKGAHWPEIHQLITELEFLSGLSRHDRHHLQPHYCALELSHEHQAWWKNAYAHLGLPTAKTAYYHNDHYCKILKMIIYLGEVGEDQGPFSFVPGSHLWQRSICEARLVKALDRQHKMGWQHVTEGFECYYRRHFQSAEFRAAFMRLPQPLRKTSHFGDDVIDESAISSMLLSKQVVCLSSQANCIAFDGDKGLHRGGTVNSGQRWALQLGFRQAANQSAFKNLLQDSLRFVRKYVQAARGAIAKSAA